MKNKDFMIFQRAVRKYVSIYEKSVSGYFFVLTHRFENKKQRKILDEKCGKIL
jgi:hypothetical protein